MSTIITFGAAAFIRKSQEEADRAMELVLERGINQIDVAPEYEVAEERVGKWMKDYRRKFFLGCKTLMRAKKEAREELYISLERLQTDCFDLYQLHAVDSLKELEVALGAGGAMESILEARSMGLLRFIGITSHSLPLLITALGMFDFDTIMFPFNFIFYGNGEYRERFMELMGIVKSRDTGVMVIKSIAKGNWDRRYRNTPLWKLPYTTWYEPFSSAEEIKRSLDFVFSNEVSTAVSASDVNLLPLIIEAAERFTPVKGSRMNELLKESGRYRPLEFTFSA